eukprot:s2688_g5.t1
MVLFSKPQVAGNLDPLGQRTFGGISLETSVRNGRIRIRSSHLTYEGPVISASKEVASFLAQKYSQDICFIDLRSFKDPASRNMAAGRTGKNPLLASQILVNPLVEEVRDQARRGFQEGKVVCFYCEQGLHRSVTLADDFAFRIDELAGHIDLQRKVLERGGCWPLNDGCYIQTDREDHGTILSRTDAPADQTLQIPTKCMLFKGYALIVGGFESGPYAEDTRIVIARHIDAAQVILREMALPETLWDHADAYLFSWGFRDGSFKIQKPLQSVVDASRVSNRRPLISRSGTDTGVVDFLRTAWPQAKESELESLVDGTLPWASTAAECRAWLETQIPSPAVFTAVHSGNTYMGALERKQCERSLRLGQFVAIVCLDTQTVLMGRWAMKILSLIPSELLNKARGHRRCLFSSLDSQDGLLLTTVSSRLRSFVYGRIRQVSQCEELADGILQILDDLSSWKRWKCLFSAFERRARTAERPPSVVRQQWQAFQRVLHATRLAEDLITNEELLRRLRDKRATFIESFLTRGEVVSSESKDLANFALERSLEGTVGLDDHVAISRLGRAIETDPQVIAHKEDVDREKAASFYESHPHQLFIDRVGDELQNLEDPFDLMGSAAREAVMMVQADLSDTENAPSYLEAVNVTMGSVSQQLAQSLQEIAAFQSRLHKICLAKMKPILVHCENCIDPDCPHQELHRTTIFDTIFPERENKPRSFDLQPLEFSVLADAVEPLLRAVLLLFEEQSEAYEGFRQNILRPINDLLAQHPEPDCLVAESFDASVSTDMLVFPYLRKVWDVVFKVIPERWLNLDFEGEYPGWQRQVAYAGAAPRVQHIGKMTSSKVPTFEDCALESSFEDLSVVSTFAVKPRDSLLKFRPPRVRRGPGWSPMDIVDFKTTDPDVGLGGFDFLRSLARARCIDPDFGVSLPDALANLEFAETLPVVRVVDEISAQIRDEGICVCSATTGTGKSTVLPLMLRMSTKLQYIMTQPRRLAADEVAARLTSLGAIAYPYHKAKKMGGVCDILVSTEYYVLQDLLRRERGVGGQQLGDFSLLILDEVHELSENMLQILAVLRRTPPEKRTFGVLIMSATGPASAIAEYMGAPAPVILEAEMPAPVIEVPRADVAEVLSGCIEVLETGHTCLLFCASIPQCESTLLKIKRDFHLRDVDLNLLHGMLSKEAQRNAILPPKNGSRKVICATAIAETSLTIPKLQVVGDFRVTLAVIFYPLLNQPILTRIVTPEERWKQRRGLISVSETAAGESLTRYARAPPYSYHIAWLAANAHKHMRVEVEMALATAVLVESGVIFKDVLAEDETDQTLVKRIDDYVQYKDLTSRGLLQTYHHLVVVPESEDSEGKYDPHLGQVLFNDFEVTLRGLMEEYARIWNQAFAGQKFASDSAGTWSAETLLAAMYPELIRIQDPNTPFAFCHGPYGQGDTQAIQSSDVAVLFGMRPEDKEGCFYYEWAYAFAIDPKEAGPLLEYLARYQLDMNLFTWEQADWNDFVSMRGTQDGQYARPHPHRGASQFDAFLGRAWHPAHASNDMKDIRSAFRDRFQALCEDCESKRKGPRLGQGMTRRGSEMSSVLSFGQLNACSLLARFFGKSLSALSNEKIGDLLKDAPEVTRLRYLPDMDRDHQGRRVGYGDDVFSLGTDFWTVTTAIWGLDVLEEGSSAARRSSSSRRRRTNKGKGKEAGKHSFPSLPTFQPGKGSASTQTAVSPFAGTTYATQNAANAPWTTQEPLAKDSELEQARQDLVVAVQKHFPDPTTMPSDVKSSLERYGQVLNKQATKGIHKETKHLDKARTTIDEIQKAKESHRKAWIQHITEAATAWRAQMVAYQAQQAEYAAKLAQAQADLENAHRAIQDLTTRVGPTSAAQQPKNEPMEDNAMAHKEEMEARQKVQEVLAECATMIAVNEEVLDLVSDDEIDKPEKKRARSIEKGLPDTTMGFAPGGSSPAK